MLQDDFGWADADWHRPVGWKEAATPHMMELLRSGVELDNMYAFKFCAPTRSSIQSGRNPIHVNVQNYQPVVWDSADPNRDKVSGYAGIPTKMTGMSAVLKSAGYATHYTGATLHVVVPIYCVLRLGSAALAHWLTLAV